MRGTSAATVVVFVAEAAAAASVGDAARAVYHNHVVYVAEY